MRQKRDYAVEYRIVLPDGTIKYLEATAHHQFSADGELVEVIGTNVDVTERKRAQEELEKLRQLEANLAHLHRLSMMGELAASLAHEVKQPIATARNNACAALLATTGVELVIWHRPHPKGAGNGASALATSGTMQDAVSWLRTRRT